MSQNHQSISENLTIGIDEFTEMDDFETAKAEFTQLRLLRSKKPDVQAENERLKEKLDDAKAMIDGLKEQTAYLEKESQMLRRSMDRIREENQALKRANTESESKGDGLKRELKFIRAVFRMGGLRYSCRAADVNDGGTISTAAFRGIVSKSNVNLNDDEVEMIVRKAAGHGDGGGLICYEAFFNALTDS